MGAVRRDEREGEERGKLEPFSFSKTQQLTDVVKPHPKVLEMGYSSCENQFFLTLFIILKIENWPIKCSPEQGGLPSELFKPVD